MCHKQGFCFISISQYMYPDIFFPISIGVAKYSMVFNFLWRKDQIMSNLIVCLNVFIKTIVVGPAIWSTCIIIRHEN